ncbi:hypothetical protein SNE40_013844 [Patella caerulea]
MSSMNGVYTVMNNKTPIPMKTSPVTKNWDVFGTVCPTSGKLYRTADGRCNNIHRPDEGRSLEAFKRFLPPAYADGMSVPRIYHKCYGRRCVRHKLPSPRLVSLVAHPGHSVNSVNSVMLMQWGQFLDHDLTAAAIEQPLEPSPCCSHQEAKNGHSHPDIFTKERSCFPITFGNVYTEPFFSGKCMEFIRSRPFSKTIDKDNPREQVNLLTSFVDSSNVYASDKDSQDFLRAENGRLKTSTGNLLMRGRDDDCIRTNAPYCFAAGDERVHVFPGLTALHTLFVRLHNHIADRLDANNDWDSETLFQETRKIIIALMQKITYEEFLPEILDKRIRRLLRLNRGYYRYNKNINPSIYNSFATAAFRFGHSLIPDFLVIKKKEVKTRKLFNNPEFMFNSMKSVVKGILGNPAELRDRFVTKEATDHLFENEGVSFDLVAMNIQRGRDHGLPPYNDFRELCGLPRVTSFYSEALGRNGRGLRWLYYDIDDVDLFTAGMSEPNLPGASLGPTFSCIIGWQFHDLKYGDSFWFETDDPSRGFTKEQLDAIRQTSFSQLLCEQFHIGYIQPNPFRIVTAGNRRVPCRSLKRLDLHGWYKH